VLPAVWTTRAFLPVRRHPERYGVSRCHWMQPASHPCAAGASIGCCEGWSVHVDLSMAGLTGVRTRRGAGAALGAWQRKSRSRWRTRRRTWRPRCSLWCCWSWASRRAFGAPPRRAGRRPRATLAPSVPRCSVVGAACMTTWASFGLFFFFFFFFPSSFLFGDYEYWRPLSQPGIQVGSLCQPAGAGCPSSWGCLGTVSLPCSLRTWHPSHQTTRGGRQVRGRGQGGLPLAVPLVPALRGGGVPGPGGPARRPAALDAGRLPGRAQGAGPGRPAAAPAARRSAGWAGPPSARWACRDECRATVEHNTKRAARNAWMCCKCAGVRSPCTSHIMRPQGYIAAGLHLQPLLRCAPQAAAASQAHTLRVLRRRRWRCLTCPRRSRSRARRSARPAAAWPR